MIFADLINLTEFKNSNNFRIFIADASNIKVLIKQAKSQIDNSLIQNEIEAYSKLSKYKLFLNIIDSSIEDELNWLAISFEDSLNLKEYIEENGPLPEREWFELAEKLITNLNILKSENIIHKDIKPSNVLMTSRGPVLIDFAFSQNKPETPQDDLEEDDFFADVNEFVGTPEFSSPEHFSGVMESAMDIFSLGSTLVYAATGQSPFNDKDINRISNNIKYGAPNLNLLSNEQKKFINPFFVKNYSVRITPTQAKRGVIAHINFVSNNKRSHTYMTWPSFEDLTDNNVATARKSIKLTFRLYFSLIKDFFLRLVKTKYFILSTVLLILILTLGIFVNNHYTKQQIQLDNERDIKCLSQIEDLFVENNYFFSKSKVPSDNVNISRILDICADSIVDAEPNFTTQLAFVYGLLGNSDKEHEILFDLVKKDLNNYSSKLNLLNFYSFENNWNIFATPWIDNCTINKELCDEVKFMYLAQTENIGAAKLFIEKDYNVDHNIYLWQDYFEFQDKNTLNSLERVKNFANQNNPLALRLMIVDNLNLYDFSKAEPYITKLMRLYPEKGYFFKAFSNSVRDVSNEGTYQECIANVRNPAFCFGQYADLLYGQYMDQGSSNYKNADLLKDSFLYTEKASLLGTSNLRLLRGEFISEGYVLPYSTEGDSNYFGENYRMFHLLRDVRYNSPRAIATIASMELLINEDMQAFCKYFNLLPTIFSDLPTPDNSSTLFGSLSGDPLDAGEKTSIKLMQELQSDFNINCT